MHLPVAVTQALELQQHVVIQILDSKMRNHWCSKQSLKYQDLLPRLQCRSVHCFKAWHAAQQWAELILSKSIF